MSKKQNPEFGARQSCLCLPFAFISILGSTMLISFQKLAYIHKQGSWCSGSMHDCLSCDGSSILSLPGCRLLFLSAQHSLVTIFRTFLPIRQLAPSPDKQNTSRRTLFCNVHSASRKRYSTTFRFRFLLLFLCKQVGSIHQYRLYIDLAESGSRRFLKVCFQLFI